MQAGRLAGCKWYLRPVVQLLQLTTVLSYGQCLTIPRFRHEAASVCGVHTKNQPRTRCAAQEAKAFSPIISPITHPMPQLQDLCRRLANEIVRLVRSPR
jgi:hypothetical protein